MASDMPEMEKSEGKHGPACAPVGFVCCPTASPTPQCVHGGLWLWAGTMLALNENMLYMTWTCYLTLFFIFELLLAKFCLSKDLLCVSTKLTCI